MLKVRLTYVDDEAGRQELEQMKELLKVNGNVINESRIYKGRNGSQYNNVYIDIEVKKEGI